MNEEKKTLLKAELILTYYKENINNSYITKTEDIVLDNSVLDNLAEKIFITTFDKGIKLLNNWNALKQCVMDLFNTSQDTTYLDVLIKIQEFERGNNANTSN